MDVSSCTNHIVRSVQSANRRQWFTWLFSQAKLSRFYSLLICNNPPEQLKPAEHFLLNLADKFKISLSRLRTSSNHLDIVVGAWHNILRPLRLCRLCATGVIGDELHFLFTCPSLSSLRKTFMRDIPATLASIYDNEHIPAIAKFLFYALHKLKP